MRILLSALVMVGLAAPALACGPPPPPMEILELLGWTADGRYMAYKYVMRLGLASWEEDAWAQGEFVGVWDARTDSTKHYRLSIEGGEGPPPRRGGCTGFCPMAEDGHGV